MRSLREHEGQVVEVGDRPMIGDMAPPAPGVEGRSHGQVGERCFCSGEGEDRGHMHLWP